MTLLLDLLGASDDSTDHAWVLRRALGYLSPIDAVRLVVAVLESGGRDARRRVHWLRIGESPLPPMDEHELLGEAASHACWRALAILLEDLRAKAPSWISLYDESIEDTVDLTTSSALARATVAHRGTHYRFGVDIVVTAATRGDLSAVQWLIPRSTNSSGHIEPTRREDEDTSRLSRFVVDEVLHAAADEGHLHIVQWVVNALPHLHCILLYDKELQAVGWITYDGSRRWKQYCSATAKHGFSSIGARNSKDTESTSTIRPTPMPLANGFARDGDLDTLKKIFARPNYPQLIGTNAIALAAEHGHLDVVKWLFELFPRSVSTACCKSAACGGQVEVLQWLQQQMSLDTATIVLNAVCKGHVEVLRWLQSTNPHAHVHFRSSTLAFAIRLGHVEVVKFLHEECKVAIKQGVIANYLWRCPSVTTHKYVLDRAAPLLEQEQQDYLERVVSEACLEVVEHLVLDRGLWSRAALAASCQRNELATSQFIYSQAKERARHLQTPLEEQLDFLRIEIGYVWGRELAMWLLHNVPEASVWRRPNPSIYDGFLNSSARQQVLLACIKHRPDECRSVPWLPQWVVCVNRLEALNFLDTSGHPNIRDIETFEAIIQFTRDARLMLKLLPLPADSSVSLRKNVVQWAAQFGMVTVLDCVFGNEESKIQETLLDHVVRQAGCSSHVEVVEWLFAWCDLLGVSNASVVKAVQRDALRHGHTASLILLRRRQLLRETSQSIGSMVSEAAQARQVCSLEWLLENLTIPEKLIANTLIDAVRQKHTEVVTFITEKYDPNELPLRDHDYLRIRDFLLRQGNMLDTSLEVSQHKEESRITSDEEEIAGRRIKRSRRQ